MKFPFCSLEQNTEIWFPLDFLTNEISILQPITKSGKTNFPKDFLTTGISVLQSGTNSGNLISKGFSNKWNFRFSSHVEKRKSHLLENPMEIKFPDFVPDCKTEISFVRKSFGNQFSVFQVMLKNGNPIC